MEHGKISKKDFVGKEDKKEHSRRDDAGFEKKKRGGPGRGKKTIYKWKPEASKKLSKEILKTPPTKYYSKKYPDLVEVIKP